MGISGVPSQIPVVILPHEEASKSESEKSKRFDLTPEAVLAIAILGGGILAGATLLWTDYWLLRAFLVAGCVFVFLKSKS